jgi:two-component system chemotaxis response regulator CheY
MTVSLEPIRFLLIDDSQHMMNIVKTILRGFGAVNVSEACTLREGFDLLCREGADIVILDYQLKGEYGVEFVQRVRNDPQSPAPMVPIIMLTAHSAKARVVEARDAGVSEFCMKPVTAFSLINKIGAVIDNPRPFVRAEHYFGPNRRRRQDPTYAGPERRGEGLMAPETPAASG